MKIVYTGLQKENYERTRGWSFEYNNFYKTLKAMSGVEVIEHPFDRILEIGKKKFNEELFALIQKESPDLLFAFMYTDELDPETLTRIQKETSTKSVAWFSDDYWRFFNYSRHWPPYFDYVVTTYHKAIEWYKKDGFENVLLSQWACSASVYPSSAREKDIEVSFVGQYKPARGEVIEGLKKRGVNVATFGFGWPGGRISQEELMSVSSRSKITLNLNVRSGLLDPKVIARIFLRKSINRVVPDFHLVENLQAYLHFPTLHTHARPFELAGSGAFVVTGYSEGIERYYENGKEMIFYRTLDELAEKIRYYLTHDEERERIAKAGYERTIKEHTYQKRFEELFTKIGLTQ